MAVGKRLRWRIFHRDNFACRYCGKSAEMGAVLEVDHVEPRALGGTDDPTNLITACEDCNIGKSDTPLGCAPLDDVPQEEFVDSHVERLRYCDVACDLGFAAAQAWAMDYQPPARQIGEFEVHSALAIAAGYPRDQIVAAAEWARVNGRGDMCTYLLGRSIDERGEQPEEAEALQEARAELRKYVPEEQVRFIWRARVAAGSYRPSIDELERAAGGFAERAREEGRDRRVLNQYLDSLPAGEGSRCRMLATADWDAHQIVVRRGDSAMECYDEVLEIAISYALNAEVPR